MTGSAVAVIAQAIPAVAAETHPKLCFSAVDPPLCESALIRCLRSAVRSSPMPRGWSGRIASIRRPSPSLERRSIGASPKCALRFAWPDRLALSLDGYDDHTRLRATAPHGGRAVRGGARCAGRRR